MRSFLVHRRALAIALTLSLFCGCGSDAPEGGPLLIAFSADTGEREQRHVYTNLADGPASPSSAQRCASDRRSVRMAPGRPRAFDPRKCAREPVTTSPSRSGRRIFASRCDRRHGRAEHHPLWRMEPRRDSHRSAIVGRIHSDFRGLHLRRPELHMREASGEIDESGGAWLAGWSPNSRRLAYVERKDESSPQDASPLAPPMAVTSSA